MRWLLAVLLSLSPCLAAAAPPAEGSTAAPPAGEAAALPPAAAAPTPAPALPPKDDSGHFSVPRFLAEILAGALVGSGVAYGTYTGICGSTDCFGGAIGGLAANMAVTPLAVWGTGELLGGNGSLGMTYAGGMAAFAGAGAGGPDDPLLGITVGVIVMPLTAPLLYEISSHAATGGFASVAPAGAGPALAGNAPDGGLLGLQGRF